MTDDDLSKLNQNISKVVNVYFILVMISPNAKIIHIYCSHKVRVLYKYYIED